MIWFRRFVAIILAFVLTIFFVVMLLVSRVNATFGNPHFYVDQLRKADVYNYMYDKALPAALEEAKPSATGQNTSLDPSKFQGEVVTLAKGALPPQWVQARVEDAINQVMPYVLGDTEKFAINVPLKDRVTASQKALKDTLHNPTTFSKLYEQIVAVAVDQASSHLNDLPYKLTLTKPELDSMVRALIPQDWLLAQMDQAIDQVFPYLAGDTNNFAVRIELKSRVGPVGQVVLDVLGKTETYNYIFDEVIVPQVVQQIGKTVQLPYGITLTRDDVSAALKQILPQTYFQARLQDLVNQAAPYLRGETNSFDVAVPLADRKAATQKALADLADAKLKALWQSLPEGTPAQIPEITRVLLSGQLPPARLPGVSYEQVKQQVGIDFTQAIFSNIIDLIPNQVDITQAGLAQLLGEGGSNTLSKARQYVSQGWTFTDADLRKGLDANSSSLDDVRSRIRSGFAVTQADLRQQIGNAEDGTAALADFDQTRHILKTVRSWLFTGWIVVALLLVAIGALGARKVWGKIAWAAAVLGVVALLSYFAAGVVYNSVARPHLVAAFDEQQTSKLDQVAMDKASEIAYRAADTFVSGMRLWALIALLIALAGLAAAIVLPMVWKKQQAHPPEGGQGGKQDKQLN